MIFLLKVAAMHKNQPEHHPALQPNRLAADGRSFSVARHRVCTGQTGLRLVRPPRHLS